MQGGAGRLGALGELPESSQPRTVGRALPKQDLARSFDGEQVQLLAAGDRAHAIEWQLIFQTLLARLAMRPDRAIAAQRLLRHTDCSAQLHERLIELAGPLAIE